MRKYVVSVVLLFLMAVFVFFAGWIQFAVPVGSFGVLGSKTNGVDPAVLRGGKFRWAAERLLPTNATVTTFSIETSVMEISASGRLPSAERYASIAGVDDDFSYSVQGTLTFSVKPEALPSLVAEQGVHGQADLDAWEERKGAAAAELAVRRLAVYASDPDELDMIQAEGSTPRLVAELETAFPELQSIYCLVRVVDVPDLALYREAAGLYADYLERRHAVLSASVLRAADSNAASRLRWEELERYGELLTKYPVLLKFLAIESVNPQGKLELMKTLDE